MGERRFKVGDWVRVKDNKGAPYDYRVGDVHKVDAVLAGLVYVLGKPGMYAKRFEPWQPRVGERVRIVNPRHDFKRGHKGREFTVDEQHGSYDGEPAFVGYPVSRPYIWTASELEPVASAVTTPEKTATIKIVAGKFYKTRDGRKVGPAFISGNIATFGNAGNYASAVWSDDGRSSSRDDKLSLKDNDIIAEWIDEPLAKPSNDNAKPNFKVGDRVVLTADNPQSPSFGVKGAIGKIGSIEGESARVTFETGPHVGDFWYVPISVLAAYYAPAVKNATTIVALIDNGQPKPSSSPHVHTSAVAAEKEAKRLAAKYKGKQFGVFTLTTTHEEAAPVYDHKWQNMAALGLKIDAIKELRAVAGLDLASAKSAVEAFEQAA